MVFQIAYDGGLAIGRTKVLRLQGYEVVSVIGNEAAKLVLSVPGQYASLSSDMQRMMK